MDPVTVYVPEHPCPSCNQRGTPKTPLHESQTNTELAKRTCSTPDCRVTHYNAYPSLSIQVFQKEV